MERRFYLGLIVLSVLLLALGGLVVRSTAAVVRSMAGTSTEAGVAPRGAATASLLSRGRQLELPILGRDSKGTREGVHIGSLPLP